TRDCRQANDPVLRKLGQPFRENAEYLRIEIDISRFQRGVDLGFVPGGSEVAPAIDDVQIGPLADPYRALIGPCRNTELPQSGEGAREMAKTRGAVAAIDSADRFDGASPASRRRALGNSQQRMAQLVRGRHPLEGIARLAW